jgi:hypothetical protein
LQLVEHWVDAAEAGSLFVVEADEPFAAGELPVLAEWDIRRYASTTIAIGEKTSGDA